MFAAGKQHNTVRQKQRGMFEQWADYRRLQRRNSPVERSVNS